MGKESIPTIKNSELITELRRIKQEELDLLTKKPEEDPTVSDDERADKQEADEENSASGEVVSKRLGDINNAIAWAEKGHAGECFVCHQEIEADRLQAVPEAITCKNDRDETINPVDIANS
ncbi:MAG: hypothetical protein NTV48_02915 [Candidatus Vogelbacteria bacterium]|nr:hypothetical protein [Candidatus Vogelbacteria bacterium]